MQEGGKSPCSTNGRSALLLIHQWLLRGVALLVQGEIGHTAGRGLGGVLTLTLTASLARTRASNGSGRGEEGRDIHRLEWG